MSDSTVPIAVVDDDEAVRRALLRLLRAEGFAGVAYRNAAEFLLALPHALPACVVLDVHMPGIDGLELQQHLAREWPDLPVIMVTGQHSPEAEALARSRHAADFLVKPIDGDALVRAIRSALG